MVFLVEFYLGDGFRVRRPATVLYVLRIGVSAGVSLYAVRDALRWKNVVAWRADKGSFQGGSSIVTTLA